jgi:hypothetical protein
MSLGLLGAVSGAYQAIRGGIDDDNRRRDIDEERAYLREARENARVDRAFGLQQRQRQVDEQARLDRIREAERNIPTTREVDTRNATVKQITVDDEDTPSAAALPVMQTRQAPKWLQIKQRADIYRKEGDLNTAQTLYDAADKAQFAESAQRFGQVRAGAESMSIAELAQSLQDIYNSDPLPAKVLGYEPTSSGGVRVRIRNEDTGQEQTLDAKNKDDLLLRAEQYFSPQTFDAWVQSKAASQRKIEEELSKPRTLRPGEIDYQPLTGKVIGRNTTPTAAQVRAAGGAGGAGGSARAGAKPVDQNKDIDDAVKFIVDSSNFKDQTTPADSSRLRRLARQFYDQSRNADGVPQLDATRAAEVAAVAVTQPDRLRLNFNPRTGEIVRELQMEGSSFIVERVGKPGAAGGLKKEELEQVARDQLSAAPVEQRELFLRAARSPAELKAVMSEIEAAQRSQQGMQSLTEALGRAPSEDEIKAVVKMTQDRVAAYGGLFSSHLPKSLVNPPKREKKTPGGLGLDWQVEPGLGNTAAEMLNQGY